jgi:type VI secretion system FHA domain protein
MILTLEVASPHDDAPGTELRKVFDSRGGTIGRVPDNDWVLPDGYVSSHHAVIRFTGSEFEIEDTSTNGVFVNSLDNRLPRGQGYTLRSGDRLFIDPYEITVSISRPGVAARPPAYEADDPFGPPAPAAAPAYAPPVVHADPGAHSEVDPLSLLGFDQGPAGPAAPRASDLARGSVLSEHYRPPSPVGPPAPGGGGLIPDDYDPLRSSDDVPSARHSRAAVPAPVPPAAPAAPAYVPPARPAPVAVPPPEVPRAARPSPAAARPAAAPAPGVTLADVLAAAGLTDIPVSPDLADQFGRIMRVVVAGVIDVLQSRQRIKAEFRVPATGFMPVANNPLKFSANVDDALHNLLVRRNPAFLGPVEAFDDAFDDIRNHQMAMLAGVRVAFESMLKQFDPERLQQEFDRGAKGSLLAVPARLRYWDLYRDRFSDMVSDADACFRELFGHEFAKAYEEQLERLKAHDRSRRR